MAIIITNPNSDTLSAANTVPHLVPEVWSDKILTAAKFARTVVPRCSSEYAAELRRGDVLHIGMISNLGTGNLPTNGDDFTFEAPQETQQTLVVDQQKYSAIMVGEITKVQAHLNVLEAYTKNLGYAHSRIQDVFMAGKFDLASTVVGAAGVELTSDNYLSIWQAFKEAGIVEESMTPGEDFSLFLSPAAYAAALKVDVFANKQYNSAADAIQKGEVGDIYGMKVFLSNLLESDAAGQHDCAAFHRDAYAFVGQQAPKFESDRLVQKGADIATVISVYGGVDVTFPPEAAPGSATYTATDNRAIYVKTI